ncbi:S8 family serine peptidase [Micromonospora echinofusca]|uniref:S8 family serine peptidase n=1 Tax=Micromonospora echinofusca TaxID=47858 RepID=A0ABS3VWN1_MICEH|nr:S8 family serine peptidase [Micromonospora echinofusca]MBO4208952.1 S8 family serine peptidase [Micromonospora echinofusca]
MAALVALAVPLAVAPASAGPATSAAVRDKADPELRARLAADPDAATTFWAVVGERADLGGADRLTRKADRGAWVHRTLTGHADRTQAGLRALLTRRKAAFTPYWVTNAVRISGDADLVAAVAARPEVTEVYAEPVVRAAAPRPSTGGGPTVNGVEWNVDRVEADRVWNELGVRGEGIVVASLDSGVNHTHPALADSYRGRRSDGTVDHNHNWHDFLAECPEVATPCDTGGHGTHVTGTMVGATPDGIHQVGVAPGAQWIAARACGPVLCDYNALVAAGQWMLAPTDALGENPRPDLAPDVVNNSWGWDNLDEPAWYSPVVESWVAAGIFPVFASGNEGVTPCGSTGSPGQDLSAYSVGAFDATNTIADFSSSGPGQNGDLKPNIAAPGVAVNSTYGDGYAALEGTSMATPHVAGAVALIWAARPHLEGDVAATRALLDDGAVDVTDTRCGGTTDDNNIWGEGRLDVYASIVGSAPAGTGTLTAHAVDQTGGAALGDVQLTLTGPVTKTLTTAANGDLDWQPAATGTYTWQVRRFGYQTGSGTLTVTAGTTTNLNLTMVRAPWYTIQGTVTVGGQPDPGARVRLLDAPVSAVTDANGHYAVTVPAGSYRLFTEPSSRCADTATVDLTVGSTAVTQHFPLAQRQDTFGYTCRRIAPDYRTGSTLLPISTTGQKTQVTLPFPVLLYGQGYTSAWISTSGAIQLLPTWKYDFFNGELPDPSSFNPNGAFYPFWDGLEVDPAAGVYTSASPTAFVVEWRNVTFSDAPGERISVSAVIMPDGTVEYHYRNLVGGQYASGGGATVGLENATGTDALEYSFNRRSIREGLSIRISPPA